MREIEVVMVCWVSGQIELQWSYFQSKSDDEPQSTEADTDAKPFMPTEV